MFRNYAVVAATVALLIFAAVFAACDARARNCAREVESSLESADRVTAALRRGRVELNEGLDLVRRGGASAYGDFERRQKERWRTYAELETMVNSLEARRRPTREIKNLAGRLIGISRSIELASRACVGMLVFAPEQSFRQPCDKLAQDSIAVDLIEYEGRLKRAKAKLESVGWLGKLFMPTAAPGGARVARKPQETDIIILLVDALRADALGAYNPGALGTPFLDRIAAEGVVFENAWAPSAGTYQSMTSFFTGTDPYEINSMGDRPWAWSRSLIPRFHAAGYLTVGISANAVVSRYNDFHRGFDYFHLRNWLPAEAVFGELDSHFKWFWDGRRPFFLYTHFIDPHAPYLPPDSGAEIASAGRASGFLSDITALHRKYVDRGIDPRSAMQPGNVEYLREAYAAEVAYTDKWLKRTFELFRSLGMLDNALVIVTSDHGEALLERGDVDHLHLLFEELVHVPLILWGRLPGDLRPGTRIAEQHSLSELLPSLLAWQGIDTRGVPAGRTSMFSADASPALPTAATNGHPFEMTGVATDELMCARDGSFKLILDVTRSEHRLFDLSADPAESKDLSGSMPGIAVKLKQRLLAARQASIAANTNRRHTSPSKKLHRQLKDLGYIR